MSFPRSIVTALILMSFLTCENINNVFVFFANLLRYHLKFIQNTRKIGVKIYHGQRFYEHKSKLSEHLVVNNHSASSIKNNLEILHKCNKGRGINSM